MAAAQTEHLGRRPVRALAVAVAVAVAIAIAQALKTRLRKSDTQK
jgi:hypothetical protein